MDDFRLTLACNILKACQSVVSYSQSLKIYGLLGVTVNQQLCLLFQLEKAEGIETTLGIRDTAWSIFDNSTEILRAAIAKCVVETCWKLIQDVTSVKLEGMVSVIVNNSEIAFVKLDHSACKQNVTIDNTSKLQNPGVSLNSQTVLPAKQGKTVTPEIYVDTCEPGSLEDSDFIPETDTNLNNVLDFGESAPQAGQMIEEKQPSLLQKSPNLGTNVTDSVSSSRKNPSDSEEKPFPCTICIKRFSCKTSLKNHHKLVHLKMLYKCSLCNQNYSNVTELRDHMISHTRKTPPVEPRKRLRIPIKRSKPKRKSNSKKIKDSKVECSYCGKFIQSKNMTVHIRTHTHEKPFECDICNKRFISNKSLVEHQKFVHLDLGHKCSLCGLSFPCRSRLGDHMNIHTGQKPHKCTICGATFKLREQLRRHSNLHSKKWHCTTCDETFVESKTWLHHKKLHRNGVSITKRKPGKEQVGPSENENDGEKRTRKKNKSEKLVKTHQMSNIEDELMQHLLELEHNKESGSTRDVPQVHDVQIQNITVDTSDVLINWQDI